MAAARTFILTGSPENYAATRDHGFSVIGFKERRRNQAMEVQPEDRIVFYLTRVAAFSGSVRVTGDLFEDRMPIWPGKPGNVDAYPWRLPTEPELVLPEAERVPAEELKDELEWVAKWPPEHWHLAFQGQVRGVSEHDAQLLMARMGAVAA